MQQNHLKSTEHTDVRKQYDITFINKLHEIKAPNVGEGAVCMCIHKYNIHRL